VYIDTLQKTKPSTVPKKVFTAFSKYNVEYLMVGGHAFNYHGVIRATLNLDLWVSKTPGNLNDAENDRFSLE
jgi:hypothetical protein